MSDASSPERPAHWRDSGLPWLWITAVTLVLDQLTKLAILARFELGEFIRVLPVLDITRAHNPGAAWSFLAGAGGWQRWFFTAIAIVVSVAILAWLRRLARASQGLLCFALVLILGGAIGNLIDRLRLGYVVDFVSVHWREHYFPAFNVADACITVGAAALILDALLDGRRRGRTR